MPTTQESLNIMDEFDTITKDWRFTESGGPPDVRDGQVASANTGKC